MHITQHLTYTTIKSEFLNTLNIVYRHIHIHYVNTKKRCSNIKKQIFGIEFRYCKMTLLRVGVFSIKQILYCSKHEFDIEATGGHFKDTGVYAKTARLYFNRHENLFSSRYNRSTSNFLNILNF